VDVFITYFRPYDHETGLAGKPDEAQMLAAAIQNMGRKSAGLEIDLSKSDAPEQLFDHVQATFGPVSVLVNNATYSQELRGSSNLEAF